MTPGDKELLLKDLCARLPYGVRCKYYNVYENCYEEGTISGFERKEYIETGGKCVNVEEVKPYLFPLSSMSGEQKKELEDILIELSLKAISNEISSEVVATYEIDFYNKNNFDYRGLIPMGLAIDATELNIY